MGRTFAGFTRANTLNSLRTPSRGEDHAAREDRQHKRCIARMRMKTERSTTRSLLIATAVSVLLAACSGGDKVSSNDSGSGGTTTSSQPTIPDDAGAVRFLAQA